MLRQDSRSLPCYGRIGHVTAGKMLQIATKTIYGIAKMIHLIYRYTSNSMLRKSNTIYRYTIYGMLRKSNTIYRYTICGIAKMIHHKRVENCKIMTSKVSYLATYFISDIQLPIELPIFIKILIQ